MATKVAEVRLPKLRRSRVAKQLSRLTLAKRSRVTFHRVYWAEHGRPVEVTLAQRLASVLGVKLASLRS